MHLGVGRVDSLEFDVARARDRHTPRGMLKDPLPVAQGVFGSTFFCNIAKHEHNAANFAGFASNWRSAVGDRSMFAVARNKHCVVGETNDHPFAQDSRDGAFDGLSRFFVLDPEHIAQGPPEAVVQPEAGQALCLRIHARHEP